ncbi:DUF2867 domain-containing protein [Pseudodesulfovibrio sp. JC047]|uniref:DUF2867 domain-containing protein n=1 Tax=Pseudodesulfovibrio sp. JC047 TaxID=2683199 RepID=UPI0013D78E66|nr:DUF2867 domain-containing protein [Pseudodesulfovibrio sp. JC047]NDV20613.1 DUF2867 domain-containing protein [Pseudodesulfovibrio sp. JC047]
MAKTYFKSIPELTHLFANADYVDVKSIETRKTLREFLADFLYYSPAWLTALYKIRAVFVRFLGMKQETIDGTPIQPDDISFTPGAPCHAFTVTHGKENVYLAVEHVADHLTAHLIVATEPLDNGMNTMHVGSIVHYNRWTGPVYFTCVRPFHHLVVNKMMAAGQ